MINIEHHIRHASSSSLAKSHFIARRDEFDFLQLERRFSLVRRFQSPFVELVDRRGFRLGIASMIHSQSRSDFSCLHSSEIIRKTVRFTSLDRLFVLLHQSIDRGRRLFRNRADGVWKSCW